MICEDQQFFTSRPSYMRLLNRLTVSLI